MHELTLNDYWSDILIAQPETGIGYQDVYIICKDGRTCRGTVLSSQFLQTDIVITNDDIETVEVL
jgi:hypothetical protein